MTMKHLLTAAAMTFALTMAANAAQPTATDQQSKSAPSMTAQAGTKGHVDGEGGSDALAKFGRQQVDGEGGSAALNRFTRTGKAEQ
jgi:hypothetical protein